MEYQVFRSRLPSCRVAPCRPANLNDSLLNCTQLLHLKLTSAPELARISLKIRFLELVVGSLEVVSVACRIFASGSRLVSTRNFIPKIYKVGGGWKKKRWLVVVLFLRTLKTKLSRGGH